MKQLVVLLLMMGLAVTFGCGEKAGEEKNTSLNNNDGKESVRPDTLVFENISNERTYGDRESSDTSAYIAITYPNVTNGPNDALIAEVNKSIMAVISRAFYQMDQSGSGSIDDRMDAFINDYKASLNEFNFALPWYYEMFISIAYNSPSVITISLGEDAYLGGAHGNYFATYFMIDTETADSLTLDDIFEPGYESSLLPMVEKNFREYYSISPSASLSDEGFWFENETFHLPQNCALVETGLLCFYNAYEVAPYVMGSAPIIVPYAELEGLLKEKYMP